MNTEDSVLVRFPISFLAKRLDDFVAEHGFRLVWNSDPDGGCFYVVPVIRSVDEPTVEVRAEGCP